MAYKTKKSKNGSISVSLEATTDLEKKYKLFSEGDGLKGAAEHIAKIAFNKMKAQYMVDKSASFTRKRKHRRKSLEDKLFSNVPVVIKKGNNKYEFNIVPKGSMDSSNKNRPFPHLLWQTEGTRKMVDIQPYLKVTGGKKGLKPITKEAARSLPRIRHRFQDKKTGRFTRDIGRIHYIKVPHGRTRGLKARKFVLAANFYLKTEAEKDAAEYIKDKLKGR